MLFWGRGLISRQVLVRGHAEKRFVLREWRWWWYQAFNVSMNEGPPLTPAYGPDARKNAELERRFAPALPIGRYTRLLALAPEVSLLMSSKAAVYDAVMRLLRIAALDGRKVVMPRVPCNSPWMKKNGGPQEPYYYDLRTAPRDFDIFVAGPRSKPRCTLLPYGSCSEDLMAQAADLEQMAEEFPGDYAASATLRPSDFGSANTSAPAAAGPAGPAEETSALLDIQRLGLDYSVPASAMAGRLRDQPRLVYISFLPVLVDYPSEAEAALNLTIVRHCIRNI